jgi:hypothetical protein
MNITHQHLNFIKDRRLTQKPKAGQKSSIFSPKERGCKKTKAKQNMFCDTLRNLLQAVGFTVDFFYAVGCAK